MKRIAVIAILAGSLGVALASEAPTLDDTSWSLRITPDSVARKKGLEEFPETLSFSGGNIATVAGQKRGFASTRYSASTSGDSGRSFTAEQKSATEGTYTWSGTVRGDEIRGLLVWTKPDRSVLTFTFRGDKRRNE